MKIKRVELILDSEETPECLKIEIITDLLDYQVAAILNKELKHGYKRVKDFISFEGQRKDLYVCYESNHTNPNLLISLLASNYQSKTSSRSLNLAEGGFRTFYLIIKDTKQTLCESVLMEQLSNIGSFFMVSKIESCKGKDKRDKKINAILMDLEKEYQILESIINDFKTTTGNITFLVGAGLSAESGIPTFRGTDGYWTVGSANYTPEEMCTLKMFRKYPEDVWHWYIERLLKYSESKPNEGHYTLVEFEKVFGDRFALITQNVDGLTYRAGNSKKRSFAIHGSINYTRCSNECTKEIFLTPEDLVNVFKSHGMGKEVLEKLRCPKCGSLLRPHILWFDECYNEEYYKYESVQHIAMNTDLLIVVGTTGATNLPYQVVSLVNYNGKPIININPNPNEMFDYMRRASDVLITKKSSIALNELLNSLAPSAGLEPATL